LLANAISQSMYVWLTHRIREQARSHMDCTVPKESHSPALLGIPMSSSDHWRNARGLRVDLSIPCPGDIMSKPITVLRDTHPLPVLDACKWEKLEGDPHTVNLNAYTSEDGSKIMGTWICTPGKWYVDYVKWEYCHFQEGYCIITPEGLEPIHLRAGDIFVVEPGMKGTWEVVETVRKYFVFA